MLESLCSGHTAELPRWPEAVNEFSLGVTRREDDPVVPLRPAPFRRQSHETIQQALSKSIERVGLEPPRLLGSASPRDAVLERLRCVALETDRQNSLWRSADACLQQVKGTLCKQLCF